MACISPYFSPSYIIQYIFSRFFPYQKYLQVAEMFVSWENATVTAPRYKLVGFQRYNIKKGASVSDSLHISPQQLELYVDGKGWMLEPGIDENYIQKSASKRYFDSSNTCIFKCHSASHC